MAMEKIVQENKCKKGQNADVPIFKEQYSRPNPHTGPDMDQLARDKWTPSAAFSNFFHADEQRQCIKVG
ncbi:MAG: hypothetical protein ONB24_00385 [candidate division KSB1 bacterium]|nr:hypothetical protein [candidate division KSB1 bacterium]